MRKFLSILLLSIYMIASIGFTINAHYCEGNLASLGLFENVSCCCDEAESGKADDCCKDEIKTIKISDDQIKGEQKVKHFLTVDNSNKLLHVFSLQADVNIVCDKDQSSKIKVSTYHLNAIPIYKRNHSFLFYC